MRLLLTLIWLLTSITILAQNGNVKVEGSINIGNHTEANPEEGTVRWTGSDLEVWNGSNWVSLTSQSNTTEAGTYVQDFDGNLYNTVQIGEQVWMQQNLKTTRYRNGLPIRLETDGGEWGDASEGLFTYPDGQPSNATDFGLLYNFRAVDTNLLCPAGWHVPTRDEYGELIVFLGGYDSGGLQEPTESLVFAGTTFWKPPNSGTNSSGFSAVGAGGRGTGLFYMAVFFSSTRGDNGEPPFTLTIIPGRPLTSLGSEDLAGYDGLSVRCIKD